MSKAPPPPMSRPTSHGPALNAGPSSAPPPHVPPPTPGQHGFAQHQSYNQQLPPQQQQQQQGIPTQAGYAQPPAAGGPPRLVGSALAPSTSSSHPTVPAFQRRPSPVRASNSPTSGQSNPGPPMSRPIANNNTSATPFNTSTYANNNNNNISNNNNSNVGPASSNSNANFSVPPAASNNGPLGSSPPPGIPPLKRTSPTPLQKNASMGAQSPAPSNATAKSQPPTLAVAPSSNGFNASRSPPPVTATAPSSGVFSASKNPPPTLATAPSNGSFTATKKSPPPPVVAANPSNNGSYGNPAPPAAMTTSATFARPIPTASASPPRGSTNEGAPLSASPSRTMSVPPNASAPPANSPPKQQQQQQPSQIPPGLMKYAGGIVTAANRFNTNSPPRNNQNDTSNTAPSPIPLMGNLMGNVGGANSPINARNVSWAVDQYNNYQRSQNNNNSNNSPINNSAAYIRGGVGARSLPPPTNDTANTSVFTENIDTVGLHRFDIQDAINSSHYAVSGSQFPLSVVPQAKSKSRAMASTVPGCITVEILVMINGAHGSGYNSKCDEVRIVNIDPARTTIRRLLNLAHKAVNFVPVSRGVFQMSARALANRRVHNLDKPLVTPIPLPDQVVSITEMVTLSEEDFADCIPLRENDVLCWVEADPVAPSHELGRPTTAATATGAGAYQQQNDMHLIGSPNRSVLASTRLPRATHQQIEPPRRFDLPERVIDVPLSSTNIEFGNMSPSRGLRKEPGNGTSSLAHRQISGRIGSGGVSTPSWRLDSLQEVNNQHESLVSATNTASSNYSQQRRAADINNNYNNSSPSRRVDNVGYAPVPHSSVSAYVNSSLRNTTSASASINNSPMMSKSRNQQQEQQNGAAASSSSLALGNGEVIYPRSEEERRLVEEIRAIRRDIENNRY